MKADKGNCFVVMDKKEYDEKMQVLLADPNTYNKVTKPPFKRIERELNSLLVQGRRSRGGPGAQAPPIIFPRLIEWR